MLLIWSREWLINTQKKSSADLADKADKGKKVTGSPPRKKNTPEALAALAAGAKAEKDSDDWQPNEEEIIW